MEIFKQGADEHPVSEIVVTTQPQAKETRNEP